MAAISERSFADKLSALALLPEDANCFRSFSKLFVEAFDLHQRMEQELGDLLAAIEFFYKANALNFDFIGMRVQDKIEKFESWEMAGVLDLKGEP